MSLHQDTMAVLRHVAVHGSRTRAEVVKAFPKMPGAGTALNNLSTLGYLADDGFSTPKNYILTRKAKDKLGQRFGPVTRQEPKPVKRREQRAFARTESYQCKPWHYDPKEYAPCTRPGSMEAFALPSRMGDRLHWRDGRITDMTGNPITTP